MKRKIPCSDSRKKRVRKFCGAHKSKASQNLHKIISTHLLTVLTIRVILQLEQRKRDKEIRRLKKISQISLIPTGFRTKTYFNIDY